MTERADLKPSTVFLVTISSLSWFHSSGVFTKKEFLYWSCFDGGTVSVLEFCDMFEPMIPSTMWSLQILDLACLLRFEKATKSFAGSAGTNPSVVTGVHYMNASHFVLGTGSLCSCG